MIRNIKGNNLLRKYQNGDVVTKPNNLHDGIYIDGNDLYEIETLEDNSQTYKFIGIITSEGEEYIFDTPGEIKSLDKDTKNVFDLKPYGNQGEVTNEEINPDDE